MLLIWKFHCAPKNWRHLSGSIFLLFFFFVCPVPLENFRQQISKLWSIVGSHFPTPDSSLTEPIQRARAPFVTYTSTLVNIRVTTAYKRYRIITRLKRHWNGRLTSFVSLITLYVRLRVCPGEKVLCSTVIICLALSLDIWIKFKVDV